MRNGFLYSINILHAKVFLTSLKFNGALFFMHIAFNLMLVIIGLSMLNGCASKPYFDEDLKKLTDNTVLRMNVAWYEKGDRAYAPASYNVDGHYHHWGTNAIQYRWILLQANMRRDMYGQILKTARIPDGMPILHLNDVVDVWIPPEDSVNYNELKAPIILKLVCKYNDSDCKAKAKKELGGLNEVVSHEKTDISELTFTKKFDTEGNLIKH